MKTYKDFEKVQLGGSDCARLILSCDRLEYLHFGSDGEYSAYFVNEEIELPSHYEKVFECGYSLWIYDDEERTLKVSGDKIEIYRAGDFGCIIYAPGGSCCRW